MPDPTPFELALPHKMDEDFVRMANDWFFKWYNINIEGKVVEVEDFYGDRIAVGGIRFESQIQSIYWRSVGKHLIDRVHKGFREWEAECGSYPPNLKRSSLESLSWHLRNYVARIMHHGYETDRRLRGRGFPDSVEKYGQAEHFLHGAVVEVDRLKAAHLALIPVDEVKAKPTLLKQIEDHFTKWRGVYAAAGLCLAAVGLIAKLFF